jgi:hypothetical protein
VALISLLQRELVCFWHAHVMPEERLLNRYRRKSTNISCFGVFSTCFQQTSKSGTPHAWKSPEKGARRRVSRVLSHPEALVLGRGWPFLWDARCRAPRATDPSGGAEVRPAFPRAGCLPLLLGLAPGGVFPAAAVAGGAVRSYRTVSPLPPARCSGTDRRCTFCGTFPGVAPAGRYPAPYLRGARTFLPPPEGRERPSGRLAI